MDECIEYRLEAPAPEAFAALFATTGWDPDGRIDRAAAAAALAPSWRSVTAFDGGRAVGTGRIVGDGVIHALIVDVIVDPAYRGRGIGTRLMELLVAECRAAGIDDVQLFCARGVRPFYERLGFVGRPDDAPGMQLEIAAG